MTKQHIFIIENKLQKVGQQYCFHLSHRTTVVQHLLVRRQFSLAPDNRTNVNVEATITDYNGEPGNIPNIFDPYLFSDLIKRQLALRTYDDIEIDLFILETSMQYGS
jgi:hypothetical protein